MTQDRLSRLLPVARAKYEAEFASVRALLQAEAHCRAQLARLDALAQEARDQARAPGVMQLLGADVLFERNIARSRSILNSDLARILARKETAMVKVRKAFGRKNAIEVTSARLAEEEAHSRADRQRDAALAPWLDGSGGPKDGPP